MKKKPKIELADQTEFKKLDDIVDLFLEKVLGVKDALVGDESKIFDFISFPKENALRKGKTPGTYIFEIRTYKGPIKDGLIQGSRNQNNWVTKKVELIPGFSKEDVVKHTLEVFGVNIEDQYNKPIVQIVQHIIKNYKERKRS